MLKIQSAFATSRATTHLGVAYALFALTNPLLKRLQVEGANLGLHGGQAISFSKKSQVLLNFWPVESPCWGLQR